jgi:DNA modification methylase
LEAPEATPPIIIDPFAGGSVRGLIAAAMGLRYIGVDISVEQITANLEQVPGFKNRYQDITKGHSFWNIDPEWVEGDALDLVGMDNLPQADLIFMCPPYYNLEVYSDNPLDLSTCGSYPEFLDKMDTVLWACGERLKPDRFMVIAIGDLRDDVGFNYGLIADLIKVAQGREFGLYNEAILLTPVGSLPVRVGKQFSLNRKLGRAHQHILIFYKGDPKTIKLNFDTTIPLPTLADEPSGEQ